MQELKKKYTTTEIKYCRRCYSPITAENETSGSKNLCKFCVENSSIASAGLRTYGHYPTNVQPPENTVAERKPCRRCGAPITAENELSGESRLCKPCAENSATENDSHDLKTPGPFRSLMGLTDEHSPLSNEHSPENAEAERKYCLRCGRPIAEDSGIKNFCKSCVAGRAYYTNAPENQKTDGKSTPAPDISFPADFDWRYESREEYRPSDEIYIKQSFGFTGTDRKFCHGCGRKMTAENEMFGTNPDGSRNEEFCQSCVKDPYNPFDLFRIPKAYFSFIFVILIFVTLSRC